MNVDKVTNDEVPEAYKGKQREASERAQEEGIVPGAHPGSSYDSYDQTVKGDRKVGLPVGAPGTVSSKTPGILQQPGGINQPGGVKAQYYDKVVEGRLGGGEEVVYDANAKADPSTGKEVNGLVGVQDRTPRSDNPNPRVAGHDPKTVL